MPQDFIRRIINNIQQNGIRPAHSKYMVEKLVAFNWQLFLCVLVALLFTIYGFATDFLLLGFLSFSYAILFGSCFFFIRFDHFNIARNVYLLTGNYSVFSISYCLGYEAGFYLYFFITPLTVYITYENCKPVVIYLALSTYLINAYIMNYLFHKGLMLNPGILNVKESSILFNLNLTTAFFMCFLFVRHLTRINRLKTLEAEALHHKQRLLEAEIHRKELNAAKDKFQYQQLESEYRQLDMFSHIISHNLRGPISRVRGILELLKMHPFASEDQNMLMEHMNTSVYMIDEVIKDLNYILVQKKLGKEATENVCLQEILKEVRLHLSEEIKCSGAIIFDKLPEQEIPMIKGIMISIFYNLISNGLKYVMPEQKPIIHIRAKIYAGWLDISFRDEGIGFNAQKYGEHIFQLYSRLHHQISGKGLGLYLVKSHVDMLGGTILLESHPGKGTAFYIRIPVNKNEMNFQSDTNEDLVLENS